MSAFEVLFPFYGLLLGLAVASVTSGMGDLWRRRSRRPVGISLPLLGAYVLLAATQQWLSFWAARDGLDMTPVNLLMSLAMALPYVFAAQIMFPEAEDPAGDGDAHFLAQKRVLLGAMMLPLAISLTFNLVSNIVTGDEPMLTGRYIGGLLLSWLGPLLIFGAILVMRNLRWVTAGLVAVIIDRLILILT